MKNKTLLYLSFFLLFQACQTPIEYDVLITNALIVDGSGKAPIEGAIGINADTIAAVGDLGDAVGKTEVDAQGKAVAPGFINMLSHAQGSLPEDPRAMSDVKQGVTLEVMGEGRTLGPVQ
jgi:N-acyl-D-amino-acid deacylase